MAVGWLAATLVALTTLLPAPVVAVAVAAASKHEEGVTLRRLWLLLHESDAWLTTGLAGWQPNGPDDPCTWAHIKCNKDGHVTAIELYTAESDSARSRTRSTQCTRVLLPELARFAWLEWLLISSTNVAAWHRIPHEWGMPGSFPRLQELHLSASSLCGPLPNLQPGSLPELRILNLEFRELRTSLPASWGSSAQVLPLLQSLAIQVAAVERLPPEWSRGFPSLITLSITCMPPQAYATHYSGGAVEREAMAAGRFGPTGRASKRSAAAPSPAAAPGGGPGRLPVQWAAGFRQLEHLELVHLGLTGQIPREWVMGGFRNVTDLDLGYNWLTGTLPETLLEFHPALVQIFLDGNSFSGPLPAPWRHSQLESLDVSYNQLSGPAFPPAWLNPEALPSIQYFIVAHNPELTGTLPLNLTWPALRELNVAGTAVHGAIPAQWCQAPFAAKIEHLNIEGTTVDPNYPPCARATMGHTQAFNVEDPVGGNTPHHPLTAAAATAWGTGLLLGTLAAMVLAFRRYRPASATSLALTAVPSGGQQQSEEEERPRLVGCLHSKESTNAEGYGTSVNFRSSYPSFPSTRTSGTNKTYRTSGISSNSIHNSVGSFGSTSLSKTANNASATNSVHLSTMLLSALADRDGRKVVQLQPLNTPTTFAHRIMSTRKAPTTAFLLSQQASAAVPAAGSAPSNAADPGSATAVASAGTGTGGRRWGMATQSLQLTADELVFDTDADGELLVLGEGGNATVYLGHLFDRDVAIKVLHISPKEGSRRMWQEASLLRQCRHKHIVELYGVAVKGELLVLAMQLLHGGTLLAALQNPAVRPRMAWYTRGRQLATQIAEALTYLHAELRVLHGDLKPGNVLLSEDHSCAYISDLGVAQVVGSRAHSMLGFCFSHAAPEQLLGVPCTLAADIYSFGVLLAEIACQQPCRKRGEMPLPRVPEDCPQDILSLILECTKSDPLQRPTAAEALQRICDTNGHM